VTASRRGTEVELTVERLGAGGDGVARLGGRTVFLPLSLPGERWRARLGELRRDTARAVPLERLAGPPREPPVCPHFGSCGGCALQHLDRAAYARFKCERITAALARVGLGDVPLEPMQSSPLASRRRLRLAWKRTGGKPRLGFRERRGHGLVPITVCPIARPGLAALIAPLRERLAGIAALEGEGELQLTLSETGIDALLDLPRAPDLADREALAGLAGELDLARLAISLDGVPEPVAVRRPPVMRFGEVAVELPPGAFLQATVEGERALQAAAAEWLPEGGGLADLFAGLGTLTLPLLREGRRLMLVESSPVACRALRRIVAPAGAVTVLQRDLVRAPLSPGELAAFAAIVLDPPKAGAAAQCAELAAATVPRIVYASCNPASFARDARTLVDGGYALEALRPVDQFLFSPEIELVARFERRACRT
jgi:23S rRNA (uracil1939-C5)-methyltransferase